MDIWPADLQQTLNVEDFQVGFGETAVRSDMDVGPAKVRSRFTDAVDPWNASIILDYTEYNSLLVFYKTTLNNGSLPFGFTNPFTNSQGIFRFVAAPRIVPIGGRKYRVSLSWELLP